MARMALRVRDASRQPARLRDPVDRAALSVQEQRRLELRDTDDRIPVPSDPAFDRCMETMIAFPGADAG